MLDNHHIALGHNRPELVAGTSEEPGEVVCHERDDGFTIEIIRPTRRPRILWPPKSQRNLGRIARSCRPHHLVVQQAGDLARVPSGVCAIQGHDSLPGIHAHLGSCPSALADRMDPAVQAPAESGHHHLAVTALLRVCVIVHRNWHCVNVPVLPRLVHGLRGGLAMSGSPGTRPAVAGIVRGAGSIGEVDIEFRRTRHQVPRAARPDAVKGGRWYLIKNLPVMRLTYQVRLLAFMAQQNSARLVIVLPATALLSPDMRVFARSHAVVVERAKN